MNITTMTGDDGSTMLFDGTRVSKDDVRMELNGQLDELNALIGLCKTLWTDLYSVFETIQDELMALMAVVSKDYSADKLAKLDKATHRMTMHISMVCKGRTFHFLLPGKDTKDAVLHLARAKSRTCERRLVSLTRMDSDVPKELLVYLNRLSDYLYSLSM